MKALTSLANPGDDLNAGKTLEFMGHAVEALEIIEATSKKPRPLGINKDLLLESSLSSPFFAEAIKKAWFIHVKDDMGTLVEWIVKLKENMGISPIYKSDYAVQRNEGVKYKPVAKKVIPVSTQDPEGTILVYREIHIGDLRPLPIVPAKMEDLKFSRMLTKEWLSLIIVRVLAGFLTKSEVELLIQVVMRFEKAIVFTNLERGMFSQDYYPNYVIRMVPHKPWLRKPIRLPQSRREEVIRIMKEQMESGKYKPSCTSYQSTFFAVEKKGEALQIVHYLQPLNSVPIHYLTLSPQMDDMIESFLGQAIYGLFDLNSGYDSRILAPQSRDLTSFYVEGMGLLMLT